MIYTFRYALNFPKRLEEDLILMRVDFSEGDTPFIECLLTDECIIECELSDSSSYVERIKELVSGMQEEIQNLTEEAFLEYKKFFINVFYFREELYL